MLRSADARASQVIEQQGGPPAGVIGGATPGSLSSSISARMECDALSQQIRLIDDRSRHVLTRVEQDMLRQDRQRATARQFEIGC